MKNSSYLCTRSETINLGITWWKAPVAELVDASDLGSGVLRRAGSSPVRRTKPAAESAFFVQNTSENEEKDRKSKFFIKKIKIFLHN